MDINIFVNEYKMCKNDDSKNRFLQKHIKDTYIPYLEKVAICGSLAKITTHTNLDGHSIFKANSTNRYMLFTMRLISLYTDIDIDFSADADIKIQDAYDILCKAGLIPLIISNINTIEYEEFQLILNMCLDDIYENERNIVGFLESQLEAFRTVKTVSSNSLKELLSNPDVVQGINKLKDLFDNYKEV